MKKKLSICIPTYNREKHIKEQLDFLCNEGAFDHNEVEIIVSNNGSSDNTELVLNDFTNKKNLLINNNEENVGLINNFLKLISLSSGDYVWIVGDDDILYPGILKKVLNVINNYPQVHHIFLNHRTLNGKDIVSDMVYKGQGGYRSKDENLVFDFSDSLNFGNYMFITANIFLKKDILVVNKLLKENNELDNYALPLAYSIYCSWHGSYIIDDVLIDNQWEDVSWSDYAIKVHSRDMICAIDIVSKYLNLEKIINPVLINHLPIKTPEIIYMVKGKKYKKNNYAMKWMLNNYWWKIPKDFFNYFLSRMIKNK